METLKQMKSTGQENRWTTKLSGMFALTNSGAFNNVKKSVQPIPILDKEKNDNTNKENDSEGGGIPTKNKNSLKNIAKHSSFYHAADKRLELEKADP